MIVMTLDYRFLFAYNTSTLKQANSVVNREG